MIVVVDTDKDTAHVVSKKKAAEILKISTVTLWRRSKDQKILIRGKYKVYLKVERFRFV